MEVTRQKSRRNGWSFPPHWLQVSAWFLLAYLVILEFALVVPSFDSMITRLSLYGVMGLIIGLLIIVNFVVTTIDPGDHPVREKLKNRKQPDFDREKHGHVIDDNYYCNICEEVVHPSSKHCRQCNKCVRDFDHHCKWLNNCIGARNYKWFIAYVGGSVLASGCVFLQSTTTFILYFAQPGILTKNNGKHLIFNAEVTDGVWIGFLASTIIVSLIICLLTTHLLVFHIKLVKRGITTYNFIMKQKERDRRALEAKKQNNNGLQQTPNSGISGNQNGWIGSETSAQNSRLNNHSTVSTQAKNSNAWRANENKSDRRPLTSKQRSSKSQVPKLPPIHNLKSHQKSKIQKTLIKTVDMSVPYMEMVPQNEQRTDTPDSAISELSDSPTPNNIDLSVTNLKSTVSAGVNAVTENRGNAIYEYSPRFGVADRRKQVGSESRPIHKIKAVTKIYEPNVETVLISNSRELTLPSIMLASPPSDTETHNDESLIEIPLHTFSGSKVGSSSSTNGLGGQDFPLGSTVYIASGQFTVSKIATTPRKSATPIVHEEKAANRVDKGVGCSPRKRTKNSVANRKNWSDSEERSSVTEEEELMNQKTISRRKHVRFAEPDFESRKIKL